MDKYLVFKQPHWWLLRYHVCNPKYSAVSRREFDAAAERHNARSVAKRQHPGVCRLQTIRMWAIEAASRRDNYAKIPTYGHTHLYLCHPYYLHADYNKVRLLPLAGNERFCRALVRLCNKIITSH